VNAGRDPTRFKVLAACDGDRMRRHEEAERKHQEILATRRRRSRWASYAWFTGSIFPYDPSTPMEDSPHELGQTQIARFKGQTVGEVLKAWGRARVRGNTVVGSPEEIADELWRWPKGPTSTAS